MTVTLHKGYINISGKRVSLHENIYNVLIVNKWVEDDIVIGREEKIVPNFC